MKSPVLVFAFALLLYKRAIYLAFCSIIQHDKVTCPVNSTPGLKLVGVEERNFNLVVSRTTSVSVSVAFREIFVAVSFTVAFMVILG